MTMKSIACDFCLESFERQYSLTRHKRHVHSQEKQSYQCKDCPKRFARRDNLWRHERSHRSEGLVHCNICTRAFRSDYLPKHVITCKKRAEKQHGQRQAVLRICAAAPLEDVSSLSADSQQPPRSPLPGNAAPSERISPDLISSRSSSITPVHDELASVNKFAPVWLDAKDSRALCAKVRYAISNNDLVRFRKYLDWRAFFQISSLEEFDSMFQDHDPLKIRTTMLMHACCSGAVQIVRHLIMMSANLNMQDAKGITALQLACSRNASNIVKLLLEGGAELELCNDHGYTALCLAAANPSNACVDLLLHAGARVNGRGNKTDFSPLHVACRNNRLETACTLLDKGADVDCGGFPPIEVAIKYGSRELLHLLIDYEADLSRVSAFTLRELQDRAMRHRLASRDAFDDADMKWRVLKLHCFPSNGLSTEYDHYA